MDERFHGLTCEFTHLVKELTGWIHDLRHSKKDDGWQRGLLDISKQLAAMEMRLGNAIVGMPAITPAIETAVMSVQSALDKLDASIPDKK